jgi:hypothetical protein
MIALDPLAPLVNGSYGAPGAEARKAGLECR